MPTPESTEQHATITAHDAKWGDLPLFPAGQWVATDDDIAFWSDMLYLRDLADAILAEHPAATREHAEAATAGSIEFQVDLYLEPWPAGMDLAADMLTAWRNNTNLIDVFAIGATA